jgi:hypothetical protein
VNKPALYRAVRKLWPHLSAPVSYAPLADTPKPSRFAFTWPGGSLDVTVNAHVVRGRTVHLGYCEGYVFYYEEEWR